MLKSVAKLVKSGVYLLPCPINLSAWWNAGSLMGVMLYLQIVSGLILACHYEASEGGAFNSVIHISQNVWGGWFFRSLHSCGASFFFILIYGHIGRGIYYHSFSMSKVWSVGVGMYLLLMAIAFLGYVLPWGQMSYWGATVITNLVTVVPYVGKDAVQLLWGGFTVGANTLKRFYVLHMYLPLVLGAMFAWHMHELHKTGSSNPLGLDDSSDLIGFHPYYTFKDLVGLVALLISMALVIFFYPSVFISPENFIPANPFKTPAHIEPEWYFLFAYTILRSIPSKLGGVAVMFMSVFVLFLLPLSPKAYHKGMAFYPTGQIMFWLMVSSFVGLTVLGSRVSEEPYTSLGQAFMVIYFFFFLSLGHTEKVWDGGVSSIVFSQAMKGTGFFVLFNSKASFKGVNNTSHWPFKLIKDPLFKKPLSVEVNLKYRKMPSKKSTYKAVYESNMHYSAWVGALFMLNLIGVCLVIKVKIFFFILKHAIVAVKWAMALMGL